MATTPKLVVGLGNPGPEYAETRHNIGFLVLDRLAECRGGSFKRKWRWRVQVAEIAPAPGGLATGKLLLAKPQTYMNLSGQAVAGLVGWRKLAPAEVLVVLDDADLPLGEVRVRPSGGSGGHRGLASVLAALGGTEAVPRVRVGIGRTPPAGA
ncbi:aminoacyl-tRNA hydrolase, partial [bacterium]|nr:aminoacyl-tRNA hydrolase [bacterium]